MCWSTCLQTRLTRSRTPGFAAAAKRLGRSTILLLAAASNQAQKVQQQVSIPTAVPSGSESVQFRDSHYGVRFEVPPGWNFTRKDGEVSTFRLDARTAPPKSDLRGVASLGFNPFPRSVLSGALVYFSVAKHANDQSCAAQATVPAEAPQPAAPQPDTPKLDWRHERPAAHNTASIGGMPFAHGHSERVGICVEQRDEVYTAYRKGSCYRFDLALNTFCSESSGAQELSREQLHSLASQMTGILSTVALDWEKTGPQPVPVPELPPASEKMPHPERPATPRTAVGLGA